jgi:peptide/nickel transport system permease protein
MAFMAGKLEADVLLDQASLSETPPESPGGPKKIVGRSPWQIARSRLRRDKVSMVCLVIVCFYVVVAVTAPILQHFGVIDPYAPHGKLLNVADGMPAGNWGGISTTHPFGVEPQTGRDVLSRIVGGITQSMLIASMATLFSLVLGSVIGIISGYTGKWVDFWLGRFIDLVLAFPQLLMLLALSVVLIQKITSLGVPAGAPSQIVYLIVVLGFFGFPFFARIIRGQVLSLREREFVEASRSLGARGYRIWFTELLPNLWAPILVYGTLIFPTNVSAEAALSFLGVGVPAPTPTLGNILTDAVTFLASDPVFFWLPALAIFLLVLSANLLGDGLRDALDPKSDRG